MKETVKKVMKKKIKYVGFVLAGMVLFGAMLLLITKASELKIINDSITVEAGEELDIKAEELVKADKEVLSQISLDVSGVDTSKTGVYEGILLYKEKEYKIHITVVDTKAPKVNFKSHYVFANDIEKVVLAEMFERVEEYSDYSVSITAYEKEADLETMTEEKVLALHESLLGKVEQEKLAKKHSEAIPTEEGVYRCVIKLEDEHGNARYEEIYVILDRTAPVIEGELDVTMKTSDLSKAPELDLADYQVTDNADGVISGSGILSELELIDSEKHIYVNHLSVVDRAGNGSTLDVTIRLVEKKAASVRSSSSSASSTVVSSGETLAHEISGFPVVMQLPELPTGCEVTALTMLLNYYGYSVSKTTMASHYLPQVASGYTGRVDLDYYFCGNPYGVGIGCGAGALVTAANGYLADSGSSLRGVDLTGASAETLYGYVSEGKPVVVMVTIGMANRKATKGWHTTEGKYVTWSDNDHGLVLIGWDANSVKVACPLSGIKTYSRAQFEKIYTERGYKAMTIM